MGASTHVVLPLHVHSDRYLQQRPASETLQTMHFFISKRICYSSAGYPLYLLSPLFTLSPHKFLGPCYVITTTSCLPCVTPASLHIIYASIFLRSSTSVTSPSFTTPFFNAPHTPFHVCLSAPYTTCEQTQGKAHGQDYKVGSQRIGKVEAPQSSVLGRNCLSSVLL